MVKAIRLFVVAVYCTATAAVPSVAQTLRPVLSGRGDPAQQQQRETGGAARENDEAATCSFCIDPCELKRQVERGLIRVTDSRGSGKKIEKLWVIDARPGFRQPCAETEETYYVGSPRTQVHIINMNPYVFDYTVTKTEEKVPETAQISFLKQLGGPLFEGLGEPAAPAGEAESLSGGRTEKDPVCPGAVSRAERFLDEEERTIGRLEKIYEGFRQSYEGTRAAYILLLDPLATCLQLCRQASAFKTHYTALPDKYAFGSLFQEVERAVRRLESEPSLRAEEGIADCPGREASQLRERERRLVRQFEILVDKLDVLCDNLFNANGARLAAMNEAIDTVRRHPDLLLTQTFVVGGYADATRVKITVEPKAKELSETLPSRGGPPRPCAPAAGGQQEGQQTEQPVVGPTPQQPAPQQPVVEATPGRTRSRRAP